MSIPNQLNKLRSAVDSVLLNIQQLVPRNAALCDEMPRETGEKYRTNPPRSGEADPQMLAPRQLTAARLLLAGKTVIAVAKQLGVDRATVFRWKRDPCFQEEIRRRSERTALKPPMLLPPLHGRERNQLKNEEDKQPSRKADGMSLPELRESNRRLWAKLASEAQQRGKMR